MARGARPRRHDRMVHCQYEDETILGAVWIGHCPVLASLIDMTKGLVDKLAGERGQLSSATNCVLADRSVIRTQFEVRIW